MRTSHVSINGTQGILERKENDLIQGLRRRDAIAIEKSADQMDEIQYASERDLAIRNADRDSSLLREVRAALRRVQDGSYGICLECEETINPIRLAVVPWASRCVRCQDSADRQGEENTGLVSEALVSASGMTD